MVYGPGGVLINGFYIDSGRGYREKLDPNELEGLSDADGKLLHNGVLREDLEFGPRGRLRKKDKVLYDIEES